MTAYKATAAGIYGQATAQEGGQEALWTGYGRNPHEAEKALEDAVGAVAGTVLFYFSTRRIM